VSALSGFILVLLGFGFLIFIHELGHFIAAKWAGIRADGFAIGMGPCVASYRRGIGFCFGSADAKVVRLHGKRPIEMSDFERESHGIGETEYSLRALPLGGYVRMLGQEDGNPDATSSDERSFSKAPIPKRAVVILAGITANLALALLLFLVAFLAGVRFPAATVGFILPGSPAATAIPTDTTKPIGLQPGDVVVAIDGDETKTFVDLRVAAAMAKPDTALKIEVMRDGERLTYTTTPARDAGSGLLTIGVDPARSSALTDVRDSREDVERGLARIDGGLAALGVGPGSRIVSVNGAEVSTYAQLEKAARGSRAEPMIVEWDIDRNEKRIAAPSETSTGSGTLDGGRTTVRMKPRPEFELLRTPATDGASVDAGIIGLAPLARVLEFADGSVNTATLKQGDIFLRVDGLDGPRISQLMAYFRGNPNANLHATVLRGETETQVDIRTDREGRVGVYLEGAWELPRLAHSIDTVQDADAVRDTPAKAIAAVALGTILSVDGEPVANFIELREKLLARAESHGKARAETGANPASDDASVSIRIGLRDPSPVSSPIEVAATLSSADLRSLRALRYGFPIPETYFDPQFTVLSANGNPLTAISMGFRQTVVMVQQVFLTIDRVARGSVGANQLQGPVGILHTGTKVADEGFMYIVFFLALISVNLAVVNLLPIPIADGGLFVFLMYERFVGRPPSIAFQNAAALAGIALVACLFLFTFYNDVARLIGS
jgi:regulator of sigma E protease